MTPLEVYKIYASRRRRLLKGGAPREEVLAAFRMCNYFAKKL